MVADIFVDDRDVRRVIAALNVTLSDESLEQFLVQRVQPYLKERAEARFRRQGDDRSGRWAPLKPSTKRKRKAEGFPPSRPINIRTGELHDFIMGSAAGHGSGGGQAYLSMPGRGTPGQEIKALIAQRGNRRTGQPARPVLAINQVDARQINRRLGWWIELGVEGAL